MASCSKNVDDNTEGPGRSRGKDFIQIVDAEDDVAHVAAVPKNDEQEETSTTVVAASPEPASEVTDNYFAAASPEPPSEAVSKAVEMGANPSEETPSPPAEIECEIGEPCSPSYPAAADTLTAWAHEHSFTSSDSSEWSDSDVLEEEQELSDGAASTVRRKRISRREKNKTGKPVGSPAEDSVHPFAVLVVDKNGATP